MAAHSYGPGILKLRMWPAWGNRGSVRDVRLGSTSALRSLPGRHWDRKGSPPEAAGRSVSLVRKVSTKPAAARTSCFLRVLGDVFAHQHLQTTARQDSSGNRDPGNPTPTMSSQWQDAQAVEHGQKCGYQKKWSRVKTMSASTAPGVDQAGRSHHREADGPNSSMDEISGIGAEDDQHPRPDPQKSCSPTRTKQVLVTTPCILAHGPTPLN